MTFTGRRPVLLVTLAVSITLSASGPAAGEDVLAFKGVRVFDGERIIPEPTVVVRDGSISAVAAGARRPRRGNGDRRPRQDADPRSDRRPHAHVCRRASARGGHLRRDDRAGHVHDSRHSRPSQRAEQPRARQPTAPTFSRPARSSRPPAATAPSMGFPIPTITSPDQADAFVAARVAEGSDYIKIVYDDGSEVRSAVEDDRRADARRRHPRGQGPEEAGGRARPRPRVRPRAPLPPGPTDWSTCLSTSRSTTPLSAWPPSTRCSSFRRSPFSTASIEQRRQRRAWPMTRHSPLSDSGRHPSAQVELPRPDAAGGRRQDPARDGQGAEGGRSADPGRHRLRQPRHSPWREHAPRACAPGRRRTDTRGGARRGDRARRPTRSDCPIAAGSPRACAPIWCSSTATRPPTSRRPARSPASGSRAMPIDRDCLSRCDSRANRGRGEAEGSRPRRRARRPGLISDFEGERPRPRRPSARAGWSRPTHFAGGKSKAADRGRRRRRERLGARAQDHGNDRREHRRPALGGSLVFARAAGDEPGQPVGQVGDLVLGPRRRQAGLL